MGWKMTNPELENENPRKHWGLLAVSVTNRKVSASISNKKL